MTPEMETKSDRILTSVKLSFLQTLPCEINVFTAQDPSKNNTKSLQKQTLQPHPPKSSMFNLRAPLDGNMSRKGFQKGSFWGGREHQKQFQKGPKVRSRTDSSKRTEFFSKWMPKSIPKAIYIGPNPLKRGLTKRLE